MGRTFQSAILSGLLLLADRKVRPTNEIGMMLEAKDVLNQVSKMQFQTRNILGLEKRLRALEAGGGGGGTNDHALLLHRDYEHAGHTGFVPSSREINGHPLSDDISLAKSDIGLSAVPNINATVAENIVQDTTHRFVTDTEKDTWNEGINSFDPQDYARTQNDGRIEYVSATQLQWSGYQLGIYNPANAKYELVKPSSTPILANTDLDLDGNPLTYGCNYDWYAEWSSGTAFSNALKKWSNDSTQAVVPALWQGKYCYDNTTDLGKSRVWLGTIRLINSSGPNFVFSDTQRFVSNLCNRRALLLRMYNTTGPYTTNATNLRETNNGTGAVRAEALLCTSQDVRFLGQWLVAPGSAAAMLGLGVNSTTVGTNNWPLWQPGGAGMKRYPYNGFATLRVGYSYCTVLERVDSGTSTFESSNGAQGLVTFEVFA